MAISNHGRWKCHSSRIKEYLYSISLPPLGDSPLAMSSCSQVGLQVTTRFAGQRSRYRDDGKSGRFSAGGNIAERTSDPSCLNPVPSGSSTSSTSSRVAGMSSPEPAVGRVGSSLILTNHLTPSLMHAIARDCWWLSAQLSVRQLEG